MAHSAFTLLSTGDNAYTLRSRISWITDNKYLEQCLAHCKAFVCSGITEKQHLGQCPLSKDWQKLMCSHALTLICGWIQPPFSLMTIHYRNRWGIKWPHQTSISLDMVTDPQVHIWFLEETWKVISTELGISFYPEMNAFWLEKGTLHESSSTPKKGREASARCYSGFPVVSNCLCLHQKKCTQLNSKDCPMRSIGDKCNNRK